MVLLDAATVPTIITMIFLPRFQQGTLRITRIARQQFQTGIHRKQFGEMLFQAAGLVRFIVLHIPTGKMDFECLRKDIQQENRIAFCIFHLFGGFAIDGGDNRGVSENGVNTFGEGDLKVGEREFRNPLPCRRIPLQLQYSLQLQYHVSTDSCRSP